MFLAFIHVGCAEKPNPPRRAAAEPGETDFKNYCAACHHPEGLGMAGGAPPLAASPWLAGPEARLVRIVLQGVRGTMEVGGKTYNLEMPGFGQILKDAEIAALLSFARGRYAAPSPPISAAAVSRIRAESRDRDGYWTVEDLIKVP